MGADFTPQENHTAGKSGLRNTTNKETTMSDIKQNPKIAKFVDQFSKSCQGSGVRLECVSFQPQGSIEKISMTPVEASQVLSAQLREAQRHEGPCTCGKPSCGSMELPRDILPSSSSLERSAQALHEASVDARFDPAKGEALRQRRMANAAEKGGPMVQIARRIARDLAQNGPVTIDDVTRAMQKTYPETKSGSKKSNNWKGSIFTGAEWRQVGRVKATLTASHRRMVGLWALKAWLDKNSLNGQPSADSAFKLNAIHREALRTGRFVPELAVWRIGTDQLSTDILREIQRGSNLLYGIKVELIPNAVGAFLQF